MNGTDWAHQALCATRPSDWWDTGDSLAIANSTPGFWMNERTRRRYLSKLTHTTSGCIRWMGRKDASGYGLFDLGKTTIRSHTASYTEWVGPVPDGLELDHVCHTLDPTCLGGTTCVHRSCVNPAHLEPVTPRENTLRGRGPVLLAQRSRAKTHCPRGHLYDEQNTYVSRNGGRKCRACRATAEQAGRKTGNRHMPRQVPAAAARVKTIADLAAAGRSDHQIAADLGCSPSWVKRLRDRHGIQGRWIRSEGQA